MIVRRGNVLALKSVALGVLLSCLLLSSQQVQGQEEEEEASEDASSRVSPLASKLNKGGEKRVTNSSGHHSTSSLKNVDAETSSHGNGSGRGIESGLMAELEEEIKALKGFAKLIKAKFIAPERASTLPLEDALFCGKVMLLALWDIIPEQDFPYQCCLLPLAENIMPPCRLKIASTRSKSSAKQIIKNSSTPRPSRVPTKPTKMPVTPTSEPIKHKSSVTTRRPASKQHMTTRTSIKQPTDSKVPMKLKTSPPPVPPVNHTTHIVGASKDAKLHRSHKRRRLTTTTTTTSPEATTTKAPDATTTTTQVPMAL